MAQSTARETEIEPLSMRQIARFREACARDAQAEVIGNAIIAHGIQAVTQRRDQVIRMAHTFSHEIPSGAVTDQGKSGRCWLFAALNVVRATMATALGLKDLELSQSYLMFFDKLEKANAFLARAATTWAEPIESRRVSYCFRDPVPDGGWWANAAALIRQYGVVPKWVMPEAFHSTESARMNDLLAAKLRADAAVLRARMAAGASAHEVTAERMAMIGEVYRMLVQFLGEPPATFDLEFVDDQKTFHRETGLTPTAFCDRYAAAVLDEMAVLWNVPMAERPYMRPYRIEDEGEGGINVPVEALLRATVAALVDGHPVWFACDVGQMADRKAGVLDPDQYAYEDALGTRIALSKGERMRLGDSRWSHAMVLTGVHLVDGKPLRFKVENSWGKDVGKDGFMVMSVRWFEEYVYEVVVPARYLTDEERAAQNRAPTLLPPWDPMF